MAYRLVIVGGGSSIFTPQVVSLCAASRALQGSTVVLMDIDEARLALMYELSQRLVAASGAAIEIEATMDRRQAVTGADFVITAISVGGFDAWEKDLEIPAKYGIFQPIGDSTGPGGIMRAFRHIPPMVGLCKDVEAYSPEAIVFNYTNPVPALCRAMRLESKAKVVGICTNAVDVRDPDFIASWVGADPEELALPPLAAGINHCAAIIALRFKDGRDAREKVRQETDHPIIRWGLDTYGVLPYAWPHWMEFYPGMCRLEAESEYKGRLQGLCMSYGHPVHDMAVESSRVTEWESLLKRWLSGKEEIRIDSMPSYERVQVIEIIEAIIEHKNEVHILNVPNRGAIENLPSDAIVEVSSLVNAYGIFPLHVGPLPEAFAAHLRRHIDVQQATVEAALSGDRRLALQAFLLDPFVSSRLSIEQTEELLEEMLAAHGEHVPQFASPQAE
jgi:alpha-galactosidase